MHTYRIVPTPQLPGMVLVYSYDKIKCAQGSFWDPYCGPQPYLD